MDNLIEFSDLLEGEIYVSHSSGNIFMMGIDDSIYHLSSGGTGPPNTSFKKGPGHFSARARKATDFEKRWLLICIEYNRYVPSTSVDEITRDNKIKFILNE